MSAILLLKTPAGAFAPASDEEAEKMKRFRVGSVVRADVVQVRNYKFLQKFMVLINLGFDAWEPPELEYKGLPAQKNRKRFRKDCIIAAGFYDTVVTLKGEVRAEAHSISFAKMEEADFEKVYNAVVNVLLQRVLTRYTRADLDDVVARLMEFA